jgi:hypothetical protein
MKMRQLLTATVLATSLVSASTVTANAASAPLVLAGNGLSVAHLGTSETTTMAVLTRLLGKSSSALLNTPGLTNCGVTQNVAWHSLIVSFDNHRLVGLSYGPGITPGLKTSAGLRLGDTLAQARVIYGAKLTTSTTQGGVWFASTPTGRIDGFLNPSTGKAPRPTAHIETIDVGVVGCPAMSP